MQVLPFLVVYGAIVSKVLVATSAILLVWRIWNRRKADDAAHVASALREPLARLSLAKAGDATVRGTFRVRGDWCGLESPDAVIQLVGELHVVRGTRPRGAAAEAHAVIPGDEVLASGQLVHELDGLANEAGYRSPAGRWVMTPSPDRGAIEVIASHPVSWAVRPGWRTLIGSALMSYGLLFAMAYIVREEASPTLAALSILAALPGTRDDALAALTDRDQFLATHESHAQKIELARLRDGCRGEARALLDADMFERAHDVAMTCGDDETAVRALLVLGRYEEAARLAAPMYYDDIELTGFALIGAGRWNEAADLADLRAANYLLMPVFVELGLPAFASDWRNWQGGPQAEFVRLHCVAEMFRAFGGDHGAVGRLRAVARSTHSTACAYVAARAAHQPPPVEHPATEHTTVATPASLQADALGRPWPGPWLDISTDPAHDSLDGMKWRAVHDALIGDALAVQRDIATVRAMKPDVRLEWALQVNLGEPIRASRLTDPEHFESLAEFEFFGRYGQKVEDREATLSPADRRALRTLRTLQYLTAGTDYGNCEYALYFARRVAMDGDGGMLAFALARCGGVLNGFIGDSRPVLASLPYVVDHRTELRTAVRELSMGFHRGILGWSPFELATVAATQRDLMRLSGNADLARRWQDIVNHHARVFSDPERGYALAMWLQ